MATYQELVRAAAAAKAAYEASRTTTERLRQQWLAACNEASAVFEAENDDMLAAIDRLGLHHDEPVAPYPVAYIASEAA